MFGKVLENARDCAISRSRYWGAPLPVWRCAGCEKVEIIPSVEELKKKTKRNKYFVVRHGEADHNVKNILSSNPKHPHHLTDEGVKEVTLCAQALKDKKIDLIFTSPYVRTKETTDLIVEQLAYKGEIVEDARLGEFNFGEFDLQDREKYHAYCNSVAERLTKNLPGGANIRAVRNRMAGFI